MLTRAIGSILKDIATGPALYDWLAHGAKELANTIVKGQPAPIYARSYGSSSTPSGGVHGPADEANPQGIETVRGPEQEPEIASANDNIVTDLIANAQDHTKGPEQEMEVER